MSALSYNVGSYNEEGHLNGFLRSGFTKEKCLSELVANSIDAKSTQITFTISDEFISLIDDGLGMNVDNIRHMFDLRRSNHRNDNSCGVSGLGAKPATLILSEMSVQVYSTVIIYTKSEDGPYLKVIIPWSVIMTQYRYEGMIQVSEMSSDEIAKFCDERDGITGTTILFRNNMGIYDVIMNNFNNEHINPEDHLGVIFGRFSDVLIICKNNAPRNGDKRGIYELKMYDYFSSQNTFVDDIDNYTIELYEDERQNIRFIFQDHVSGEMEFRKSGAGYSKDIQPLVQNKMRWNLIGVFEVNCGMHLNNDYFNMDNPIRRPIERQPVDDILKEYLSASNSYSYDYDKDFFGSSVSDTNIYNFLSKVSLVRNNQTIGVFEIPDLPISSARADYKSMMKVYYIRAEVKYDPISTNNNRQDIIMGIQENKTQWNGKDLKANFTRLIKYIKEKKFNSLTQYFRDIIISKSEPPVPAPAPEPPLPAPAPEPPLPEPPLSAPAPEPPLPEPPLSAPAPEPPLPEPPVSVPLPEPPLPEPPVSVPLPEPPVSVPLPEPPLPEPPVSVPLPEPPVPEPPVLEPPMPVLISNDDIQREFSRVMSIITDEDREMLYEFLKMIV